MSYETLRRSLLADAAIIREQYQKASSNLEKRKLRRQYEKIDKQLSMLPKTDLTEEKKEEIFQDILERDKGHVPTWMLKEQANKDPHRTKTQGEMRQKFDEKVERERKHIVETARAGVRDVAFARIKNELNHLLNNYSPVNDNKIETLIDKWRRSGDPGYDPSVRLRFRNIKKKKSRSDYAL